MELTTSLEIFASLSQETRLRIFRLLIEYGRDGLIPSKIADELEIPKNTLSFHLSHMTSAGLITSQKNGRSLTYFANTNVILSLIEFLQANCCAKEQSKKSKKKSCSPRSCT
jgi:ArsR family transcriptional regulator